MNLALNNLQRLICHKTQTTNQQLTDITTPGQSGHESNANKEVLNIPKTEASLLDSV